MVSVAKGSYLLPVTLMVITGCSSAPKVLSVKSFPAEAEVCLKGKMAGDHFESKVTCVGHTPFEAAYVDVMTESGKLKRVHFNSLKSEESFYLILKKDGYASQSVPVPAWDQVLSLKKETTEAAPALPVVAAPAVPVAPAHAENGSLKVVSNPLGALVYINGALQGNTPYVYHYPIQTPGMKRYVTGGVKVKLEAPGFQTLERMVNLNQAEAQEINFQLAAVEKVRPQKMEERRPASVAAKSEAPAAEIKEKEETETSEQNSDQSEEQDDLAQNGE